MVDYSKWQNIEVSDDEDEDWFTIHPQSRLRQIRLERMEKHKKEVEKLEKKKVEHNKKMSEIKEKLSEARLSVAALERELKELEKEGDSFQKMEEELREKEVKAPLNTDTISKPGFSKTVINTSTSAPTEKEIFYSKQKFIEEHEEKVRHYGMLRRYDESRAYLKAHDYLVCQSTADYLISWCAVLEVGHQDEDLLKQIAHQHFCLQHILNAAKARNQDPRILAEWFFAKVNPPKLRAAFEEELDDFKALVRRIAFTEMNKIAEAERIFKENSEASNRGPGVLDPEEVFNSLPLGLQISFQTENHFLLRQTISKMKIQDVIYHMDRCIDSGLWIPNSPYAFDDISDILFEQ